MHFLRLYLMSICCVASVNVFAYGLTSDNDIKTSSSPSTSSAENDQTKATKLGPAAMPKKTIKLDKNPHMLNKKLLNKLGLAKVRAPNSHNRKRLAVESRRHASPDDSHMFIIKLPPNRYYYTSPKSSSSSSSSRSSASAAAQNSALDHGNGKKVSFNFNSNGKPGRIYHWNLPVLKKIVSNNSRFPAMLLPKDELIDIKNIPTWTKPWENETIEKSYGKSSMDGKKSLKRKSPSYYEPSPSNAVKKNGFSQYFTANGKPKGFYLLKGNHLYKNYLLEGQPNKH